MLDNIMLKNACHGQSDIYAHKYIIIWKCSVECVRVSRGRKTVFF